MKLSALNKIIKEEVSKVIENQGYGYRMTPSDDYEVDPRKYGKDAAVNIIHKLKAASGIIDVSYSEGIFKCEPGTDLSKYLTPQEMKMVRKLDDNEITETSNSSGVAGYMSPMAFTGQPGKVSKKQKQISNQLGYKLVDDTKEEGIAQYMNEDMHEVYSKNQAYSIIIGVLQTNFTDMNDHDAEFIADQIIEKMDEKNLLETVLKEGLDSYYFKDENLTSEQKLGLAMRQVRNSLQEVEKVVSKTIKMKNENGINSTEVGKRTYQALKRINEKTIRLMIALQELK